MFNRRQFIQMTAAGLVLPPFLRTPSGTDSFRIAVIADTHVIDPFYVGPEGNAEDTESIFKTTERLTAARAAINRLDPAPEMVFVVGDVFHDYPSPDLEFYFQNTTRVDLAKQMIDGFRAPVHIGFGNHDYSVPRVSREVSHELFRRKFNVRPYYAVEHRGWKFIHLNNFLGTTWQAGHEAYAKQKGSLGEEQLTWLDAQLSERAPTFIFIHFPLSAVVPTEVADMGLHTLLKRHAATVQRVNSGHWHRWVDVGTTYGPQHLVMASTRYDEDAYLLIDIDSRTTTHRLVNLDGVEWNTHFSRPYIPATV